MVDPGAAGHVVRLLSRRKLLGLLDELEAGPWGAATQMLPPGIEPGPDWGWLPGQARRSPAGLALIRYGAGGSGRLAVAPPFPVLSSASGCGSGPLRERLSERVTVGIILLRLGRYAVGAARDETLAVAKCGARYVKGAHRAGGQSAKRFQRNREKWIREFFDEACEAARTRFAQVEEPIDWLVLGGDRHTLGQFMKRCGYLAELSERRGPWLAPTRRPGRAELDEAVGFAWSSRVYEPA